jgi:ribosomal protein S18 acetylase RimI-like enzyme
MAVLDSKRFFERYENEWRPKLVTQFAKPSKPESGWSRIESVYNTYHEPDYFCPEPYDQYPSHLHIDLLPRAQGHGYGRKLIEQLITMLRNQGSVGVHLGMSSSNDRAYGFYLKLGFTELCRDEESIYLGMRL